MSTAYKFSNPSGIYFNVQNLDYTYTLQGWIKGVNMPYEGDPGMNGLLPSKVPKDAFAYTLGYFKNDYKAIGAGIPHYDTRDQLWARNTEVNAHDGLYNGNISWMVTDLPSVGQAANDRAKGMQAMLYKYDQLNRITKARSLTNYSPGSGFAARSASPAAYDVDYSYDPNGNLLTLLRRDQNAGVLSDFHYNYYNGTNRLMKVEDINEPNGALLPEKTYNTSPLTPDGNYYERINVEGPANVPSNQTVDLKATEYILLKDGFIAASGSTFTAGIINANDIPQPDVDTNYSYDEIGNLIADKNEGIDSIRWTPYGKVRVVIKKDSSRISFRYDGTGNRIEKKVSKADTIFVTSYVRDASGNVMATYKDSTLLEQPIYGSSRLGIYKGGRMQAHRTLGSKNYELSNHLGNIVAVVSDIIHMSADSAWATVVSSSDYYPFGLNMEGRSWNDSTYRYGFNGKEKVDEIKGTGKHYDYGDRNYDPRIGRWWSLDPLKNVYTGVSPYVFGGNSPIVLSDPDGNILRDKDGNIIVTSTGTYTGLNYSMAGGITKNANGTYTGELIARNYEVVTIYADDGTPVEALRLVEAHISTGTFDSKGNLNSVTGKKTVDGSKFDATADCHGYTFASNNLWINNDQVDKILDHDNYTRGVGEKEAEVVIFKDKGEVIHSGRRNSDGTYTNNAGYSVTESGVTLEGAARGLTDVSEKGNVEFAKKNTPDKQVNITSGTVSGGLRTVVKSAVTKALETKGPGGTTGSTGGTSSFPSLKIEPYIAPSNATYVAPPVVPIIKK